MFAVWIRHVLQQGLSTRRMENPYESVPSQTSSGRSYFDDG
jgi:hypothetical protein